MRSIPDTNRSDCGGEISEQDRDSANSFTGRDFYQDLIARANSVSFQNIFNHYHLPINRNGSKSLCPLPGHKGGREKTPSFLFYPQTNSYHCYGCGSGAHPCDFVALMDKTDRVSAAYKILSFFKDDISEERIDSGGFVDSFDVIMSLSDSIREFRRNNTDQKAFNFIENICKTFDKINNRQKYKLNNEAINFLVSELKTKIKNYNG